MFLCVLFPPDTRRLRKEHKLKERWDGETLNMRRERKEAELAERQQATAALVGEAKID
jgi:hypothetical protein